MSFSPVQLYLLERLLSECTLGELRQDDDMPACVTHETRRGTENLLITNAEGYFSFKNPAYAELLVFAANNLPALVAAQKRITALENCRDILDKVNQGHQLGIAAQRKINTAIAATRT